MGVLDRISAAIIEGKKGDIVDLTNQALAEGLNAKVILDNGLVAGMDVVAARFRKGDMFVPEVLLSARTTQAALSILTATLSGANLIHDVGYLESGITGSASMLAMSNEVIGMAKHIARGIVVDDEHLAVDVIDKVGPGGHFLGEDHTLAHFKKEFWFPQLMDRHNYEQWVAEGSKRLSQRVDERVLEILGSHQPAPLPDEILAELKSICVRADQQVK